MSYEYRKISLEDRWVVDSESNLAVGVRMSRTSEVQSWPGIIVSSAAPSDSDGRPDGTIYIQTA